MPKTMKKKECYYRSELAKVNWSQLQSKGARGFPVSNLNPAKKVANEATEQNLKKAEVKVGLAGEDLVFRIKYKNKVGMDAHFMKDVILIKDFRTALTDAGQSTSAPDFVDDGSAEDDGDGETTSGEGDVNQNKVGEVIDEFEKLVVYAVNVLKNEVPRALDTAETAIKQENAHQAEEQLNDAERKLFECGRVFEETEIPLEKISEQCNCPPGTVTVRDVAVLILPHQAAYRQQSARLKQLKADVQHIIDPNAPSDYQARPKYLKLIKDFKDADSQLRGPLMKAIEELVQRCQNLDSNPGFKAKPEVAAALVEKVVDSLSKVEVKAFDLMADFTTECNQVVKRLGSGDKSARALEECGNRLSAHVNHITAIGGQCRQGLRRALSGVNDPRNPKVQEALRKLPE